MKCLIAVAFLVLVATAFAEVPVAAAPTYNEQAIEPVKSENTKQVRDKRGLIYTSPAYVAYPAPVVYRARLPYAYSAAIRQYPSTYVAGYPYRYSPVTYVW